MFSPCHDFTHDELIYAMVWSLGWSPFKAQFRITMGSFLPLMFLFARIQKTLAVKQHLDTHKYLSLADLIMMEHLHAILNSTTTTRNYNLNS